MGGGGGTLGTGEPGGSYNFTGQWPQFKPPGLNAPPPGNYVGGPTPAKNPQGGVGSMDWMKWHPDYKPTMGTAAWGSTHPDPAQNVKYGSAQWQQTHPNYQAPGLTPPQQPQFDIADAFKQMFGGGQ